jgi:hypothetical protein
MNTRCYRCGNSFSLSREVVESAVATAGDQKNFVVHCPRCRTANKVPMQQLKRSLPAGWTPPAPVEAPAEPEAVANATASVPAAVAQAAPEPEPEPTMEAAAQKPSRKRAGKTAAPTEAAPAAKKTSRKSKPA